jgi:hypothetical protein
VAFATRPSCRPHNRSAIRRVTRPEASSKAVRLPQGDQALEHAPGTVAWAGIPRPGPLATGTPPACRIVEPPSRPRPRLATCTHRLRSPSRPPTSAQPSPTVMLDRLKVGTGSTHSPADARSDGDVMSHRPARRDRRSLVDISSLVAFDGIREDAISGSSFGHADLKVAMARTGV